MVFLQFILLGIAVGGVWLLCGLGPYVWVRNAVPHRGVAGVGLCAGLGLALLAMAAAQIFYLEAAPIWTVFLAGGVSSALLVAAPRFGREGGWSTLKELWRGAMDDHEFWVVGLLFAAIVFLPGYRGGFGQPYRIGIDQVGYAVTAQYLRGGGTPSELRAEVIRQTGQPDEERALNAHVTSLSFNVAVAGEFLLKAYRFCYPMYVAGIAQLLGLDPVVNYQFCLLAVPWMCTLLLLLWFFRDVARLPELVGRVAAVVLALNANQLNILFEGQHAQVIVWPLLVIFFGLLLATRSPGLARGGWGMVALVGAGIFCLYSDSFIALGTACAVLWLADGVSRDWPAFRRTTFFGLAVAAGLLLLHRYTFEWVGFILRHLANLGGGNGGWPQPHWASPAGIAGYFSMYRGQLGATVPRSGAVAWTEGVVVALMLAAVVCGGYRAWRGWRGARYWLAPALVALWVYVELRWLKGFHNYGYMKVYTLLLLPVVGLHWTSLHQAVAAAGTRRFYSEIWANRLCAGVMSVVMTVGIFETVHYNRAYKRLPVEAGRVLARLDQELDLSRYAILTYPEGGIGMATLAAYARLNWLNISWSDKYLGVHGEKPILVVLVGSDQPYFQHALGSAHILAQGPDVLVIETGRRVSELGLPECNLVADKLTTSLVLTHNQFPLMTDFLREQFTPARSSGP